MTRAVARPCIATGTEFAAIEAALGSAINSRGAPVTAAGETTDASRARPKPPPGRVATATVDAFKRPQGIGGTL